MNKFTKVLVVSMFALGSTAIMAADLPSDSPPALKQANKVPDSTANGNYLESQPDENGATTGRKGKKNAKATNIEKGKNHTDSPEDGGAKVDSK